MTDAEWALISPHLPELKALGRPRIVPLRGVVETLICILISSRESTRTGGRVEKSAMPARGDRGVSESDITRSYSECQRTTPRSGRVRRRVSSRLLRLQPA